jgi:hypothetical protein
MYEILYSSKIGNTQTSQPVDSPLTERLHSGTFIVGDRLAPEFVTKMSCA